MSPAQGPDLQRVIKREGLDTVDGVFSYTGGEDLSKANLGHRRRTRLTVRDDAGTEHVLYLKRYGRQKFSARLRSLVTCGRLTSPARLEKEGIDAVASADIATMRAVGFGEAHDGRSYLIVTSVPGDSLERTAEVYLADDEQDRRAAMLTEELVRLARRLHGAGLFHRDFYACHIFMDSVDTRPRLYLIDLARVFTPRWRRFRWQVKDLAQLKYSMPAPWVESHWNSFMQGYLAGGSAGKIGRYDRAIDRKVRRMQRRSYKYAVTATESRAEQ